MYTRLSQRDQAQPTTRAAVQPRGDEWHFWGSAAADLKDEEERTRALPGL